MKKILTEHQEYRMNQMWSEFHKKNEFRRLEQLLQLAEDYHARGGEKPVEFFNQLCIEYGYILPDDEIDNLQTQRGVPRMEKTTMTPKLESGDSDKKPKPLKIPKRRMIPHSTSSKASIARMVDQATNEPDITTHPDFGKESSVIKNTPMVVGTPSLDIIEGATADAHTKAVNDDRPFSIKNINAFFRRK